MGYIDLFIDPSPSGTGYDDSLPTQNNELLAAQIHNTLQDMDDQGSWYLNDNYVDSTSFISARQRTHDMIEDVFDYAEGAISTYRDTGTPVLAHPIVTTVKTPVNTIYDFLNTVQWETYGKCMQACYAIYYMWKTEEDPLLIVEKIKEILLAFPMNDTTIQLSDETGQSFRVYPAWNNVET